MKDFCLSDKIHRGIDFSERDEINIEDVKEAVRLLKEEINKLSFDEESGYALMTNAMIDSIFGDELTK